MMGLLCLVASILAGHGKNKNHLEIKTKNFRLLYLSISSVRKKGNKLKPLLWHLSGRRQEQEIRQGGGTGWLPEKLLSMQGQGRGRRLLPLLPTNKAMFFFVNLESIQAELLSVALVGFCEETGGCSRSPAAFCRAEFR
ncbi:unnamed protein product [Pleuronectes platessa]|uniref:Secreted protein n=1 Tax=Pleuronectes platessa TaxID=8262 RepID=A0A9N7VNK3_PLEPL|nr:unnamed protein product [Pleuronectes platessa]